MTTAKAINTALQSFHLRGKKGKCTILFSIHAYIYVKHPF